MRFFLNAGGGEEEEVEVRMGLRVGEDLKERMLKGVCSGLWEVSANDELTTRSGATNSAERTTKTVLKRRRTLL